MRNTFDATETKRILGDAAIESQDSSTLIGPVLWVVVAIPIIIGLSIWLLRESLRLPGILRRMRRNGVIPIGYINRDPAQLVAIQPVGSGSQDASDGEGARFRGATLWRYREAGREAVSPERVWLLAKANEFTWLTTTCLLPPDDSRHTFSGGYRGWSLVDGLRDLESFLDHSPEERSALRREIDEAIESNHRPPGYLAGVRISLR